MWLLLYAIIPAVLGGETQFASVTYEDGRFEIHDFVVTGAAAWGNFENEIFTTGWSFLEVTTNETFPDPVQAYAAGLVEGHLTKDLLEDHFYNLVDGYCDDDKPFCDRLQEFLQRNMAFIRSNVGSRDNDSYWHHVALSLEQLHGLEDSFNGVTSQPTIEVDLLGLLLLNLAGDMVDLEVLLNRTEKGVLNGPTCSALIKVLPGNADIFFGHASWEPYNWMLRILKKYSFSYHTTMSQGAPVIPGHTSTFSSQPGFVFSVDDFYLISSGLAALETSLMLTTNDLYGFVDPDSSVLEWQRCLIANRLASTGQQWTEIFGLKNSGTYNNQWNILDYKKFQPGQPLQDGLLWTLEQLPGIIHAEDLTHKLKEQSYFPSYNVPYFEDIFNLSGYPAKVAEGDEFFSYDNCPRANIFRRDQSSVTGLDSMMKLMRYNRFQEDPLSRCACDPPFSATSAIASRDDLNDQNGTYPFEDLGYDADGAVDAKVTSAGLFKKLEFVSAAGPTSDDQPPFRWSTSGFDHIKHRGQPDLWDFKPVTHRWGRD